ncbi:MAG: hypothetical protein CME72_12830 [Halomonadaceae bacterium]|nr:hypothetical protein [Halomonadaceae bacterium]
MQIVKVFSLVFGLLFVAIPARSEVVWDGNHIAAGEDISQASGMFLLALSDYMSALRVAELRGPVEEYYQAFVSELEESISLFESIQEDYAGEEFDLDMNSEYIAILEDNGVEVPVTVGELAGIAIDEIGQILSVAGDVNFTATEEVDNVMLIMLHDHIFRALNVGTAVAGIVSTPKK